MAIQLATNTHPLRLAATAAATFAILLLLSACTILAPEYGRERAELEHHWRVWEIRGSSNYSYVQQRFCFCTTESIAAVTVTVRQGSVEQRRYSDSGTQVPLQLATLWGTVDDLFRLIDDALKNNAASLLVTYHPTLGYPTHIAIDYRDAIADDELTVTASNMLALGSE